MKHRQHIPAPFIGALCVLEGLITIEQLEDCLLIQADSRPTLPLGQLLVQHGYVTGAALQRIVDLQREMKTSLLNTLETTLSPSADLTALLLQIEPDQRVVDLLQTLGVAVVPVQTWDAVLAKCQSPWPDLIYLDPALMIDIAALPVTIASIIQILPSTFLLQSLDTPLVDWVARVLAESTTRARERRQRRLVYERLHQREVEQSTMATLLRLCASGTPQRVQSQLVMSLSGIFNAETGRLYRRDPLSNELTCEIMFGNQQDLLGQHMNSMNQRLAEWVANSGKSLCVADLHTDSRFSSWFDADSRVQLRSMLSAPLIAFGDLNGVLQLSSIRAGVFTSHDLFMLNDISTLIALALVATDRTATL